MDVKYVPEEWQGMKDGLDALTGGQYGGGMKAGLIKLNDLLEDIESKIKDKDSDRSISFTHTSKKSKIEELFKDYQKLAEFCLKAGSLVEDHIDSPFYKKIDAFAEKMRGLTIHNYTTVNRIGSKETTYVGYGMSKQAVETDKAKVSVNDIFKDSESFDHVLSKEFEEFQINHPDIELSYEEYMKAIASSRGFEYESIGDVQKNQELWRDLLAGAGIIVLTIFCAPAGLTVAVAYGGANITSAATGKDWMTQRELNTGERFERGVFGALDIIPGAAAAKGSFKSVATIGQISSKTEHVVQSLKDSKNIWANRMKVNGLKAQDRLSDAGFAIKKQFAKSADALSDIARGAEAGAGGTLVRKGSNYSAHVNDAHKASKAKMQDSIQRVEKEIEAGSSKAVKEISKADKAKLEGWSYPPSEEKYLKYKEVYDNPKYYNQETGDINWPPNNGFDGEPVKMKLQKGMLIDRFGGSGGSFFSPEGIPYEQRALALHSDEVDYYVYEVIRPLEVDGGKIAPWFDRPGGGTQYIKYHENGEAYSINELIDEGYIREVSVRKGGLKNE
ncbi:glycohydrolase toxin TNT-related protein [Bacillus haynesii]|uniref:glycohydrolase toxin TNT-related protein n=1 Tax=Bacillus haynesii TaxID=1925021 RepID=UPI00227F7590|nr:glycohydrolase toxin TNT-related protein [Bacillus haynesii]MCY8381202.1 glycohydrolase toxin TNT-related protein [Bacillus haynesii]MEC0675096.1 glycohydrolase toxin TNT-related protein [Bacillus haynesii]